MTTMDQFKAMRINERWLVKFAPMGDDLYNGLGYLTLHHHYWTARRIAELHRWGKDHGLTYDGPVIVFPDDETFILCKMKFE